MKTVLLVPVDFSKGTRRLIEQAGLIAQESGSSLVLLHVSEPVAAYVPVGASMDVIAPPPAAINPADNAPLERRLEEFASPLRSAGIEVETRVITGLAVEEIMDQAELLQPKYLVLASHGHGALYHLFSGSVVTGVLKQAKQPVVVVPVHAAA
jgi:nucleotide-binding universal stress UspA family protein